MLASTFLLYSSTSTTAAFSPAFAAVATTTTTRRSTAFTRNTATLAMSTAADTTSSKYSIPDQPARFAKAKEENNQRYLNIESVYDGSYLKGLRVAVTGANRGIGLALAKELTEQGAKLVALCRSSSEELEALEPDEIVVGVDVTDDDMCESIKDKIKGGPIDIVSAVVIVAAAAAAAVTTVPFVSFRP